MLLIFMLCSVALIARAVNLQVMETDFLQGQGKARYLREVTIALHRGLTIDRIGKPWQVTQPVNPVWEDLGNYFDTREK